MKNIKMSVEYQRHIHAHKAPNSWEEDVICKYCGSSFTLEESDIEWGAAQQFDSYHLVLVFSCPCCEKVQNFYKAVNLGDFGIPVNFKKRLPKKPKSISDKMKVVGTFGKTRVFE